MSERDHLSWFCLSVSTEYFIEYFMQQFQTRLDISVYTESEKHQEPRNQVPEEGSESEEGLARKSVIKSCMTFILS